MKIIYKLFNIITIVCICAIASLVTTTHSFGDSTMNQSKEEVEHRLAAEIRHQAMQNAKANLEYENIYPQDRASLDDIEYLSYQIKRLGKLIQELAHEENSQRKVNNGFFPLAPPLWISDESMNQKKMTSLYGPEGPTVKSVKLLMEYRLLLAANPRLKLGKIEENKKVITAQILTIDNSIVQTYIIDKKSGLWQTMFK